VQRADTPARAAPGPVAPFIQIAGKGFGRERGSGGRLFR
jgi:hypothetical protein